MAFRGVEISPHARERAVARVGEAWLGQFVAGVKRGVPRLPLGDVPWAVKVVQGATVLGYAVGQGRNWTTTLSGGQAPLRGTEIITVSL